MNSLVFSLLTETVKQSRLLPIKICKRNLMTITKPHNRISKIAHQLPSAGFLPPTVVSCFTEPVPWKCGPTRHLGTAAAVASKKKKTMAKLTESERVEVLKPLLVSGWSMVVGRDAIYKEYQFADFIQAFSFMTAVAIISEKNNHHPEWFNVYNKVNVTMSTHDVGGLSMKDIKAATFMDTEAKRFL